MLLLLGRQRPASRLDDGGWTTGRTDDEKMELEEDLIIHGVSDLQVGQNTRTPVPTSPDSETPTLARPDPNRMVLVES